MPIAKEQLKIGFTVVANPGTYVSNSAVEQYGWQDKVEPGDDPAVTESAQQARPTVVRTEPKP